MIDHTGVNVADIGRSKAFYRAALAPLDYGLLMEFDGVAGFGVAPKPDFWIGEGPSSFQTAEQIKLITPTHIAFAAQSRAEVEAFHVAALAAGGKDFGAPGARPMYHPHYYGSFVLDPDGHNVEAVHHKPE